MLGAFFLLYLLAGWPAVCRAAGQIVDTRPLGNAGPQSDAALISPQPLARPLAGGAPATASQRFYQVQSGDTLSGIATRLGIDVALLAAFNRLGSIDQIAVGQVLRLDPDIPPAAALPAGGTLARIHFWPWPPVQGQTLAIWLQAHRPVTFTITYEGGTYPVHTEGRRGWVLVPIPPLTEPGPKPLLVTAGEQTWRTEVPVQPGSFSASNIPAEVSQPILSAADKVAAEAAALAALFETITPGGWTPRSRFTLPLAGEFPRTSPFGSRRTYGDNPAVSAHAGEDFSAATGAPVYAPAAGRVVLAATLFVRGNAVVLDHGNGVFTGYWHLSALDVAVGDQVTRGQLLGEVGSTGLSTAAHLHWELRIAGMAVDPIQWVAP